MPVFRYQAIDDKGKGVSGTMAAQDEAILEDRLKGIGVWLLEANMEAPPVIDPKAAAASRSRPDTGWGKVPRRELIEFCSLMSFQTRVGIPIMQALEVAGQDCRDRRFRRILQSLQQNIASGDLLYQALEKYP